jgi:hypothetical protein
MTALRISWIGTQHLELQLSFGGRRRKLPQDRGALEEEGRIDFRVCIDYHHFEDDVSNFAGEIQQMEADFADMSVV